MKKGAIQSRPKLQAKSNVVSIFQLVGGTFAIFISLLLGIILFGSGWASILGQNGQLLQASPAFMNGFAFIFIAATLGPSTLFAFQRVSGKKIRLSWLSKFSKIKARRIISLAIISLILGALLRSNDLLTLIALPPIHAIATGLIIYLLIRWATQGIELGTPQRYWGVFSAGIIFGPLLAIVMEVFIGAIFLVAAILYVSSQSQYSGIIEYFSQINPAPINDGRLLEILSPLANDPTIVILILAFLSIAVPLIEESVKPIGLYLSMGRNWTAASGFALGALSGAGFALFEYLLLASGTDLWLPIMIARIGTSSVHILTSGLIGLALVRAKNEKRYLQLPLTFLLSVSLHGLWNGFTILLSISEINSTSNLTSQNGLTIALLLGMLILALGSFSLLRYNNRRFVASD